MCGLYTLQVQLFGLYFLISVLKAFTVSNCFKSLGTISQISGPRIEMSGDFLLIAAKRVSIACYHIMTISIFWFPWIILLICQKI